MGFRIIANSGHSCIKASTAASDGPVLFFSMDSLVICIYIYIHIYIYIYVCRERERDNMHMYLYIYIYIYIHNQDTMTFGMHLLHRQPFGKDENWTAEGAALV